MKIFRKQRSNLEFVTSNRDVPIVELEFSGGIKGYAVVDTGSEYTVFESHFVSEHRDIFSLEYTDTCMQVINAFSRKVIPIVNANVSFTIGKAAFNLSGIKNEMDLSVKVNGVTHSIVAIIGNDFLTEYNGNIDYKKKIVSLLV